MADYEPKIVAFLCNWCAYAGADLAGVSRLQYPQNIRILRVMCTGRLDPLFVVRAFIANFDAVLVLGWHPGECHYLVGNIHAREEMEMVSKLLEISGVGKERLRLDWVSASEAGRFVQIVTDFTAQVKKLGRFEVEPLRQRLQAALMTVLSGRIRRLVGKQVELIEKGNVYGEKLPAEQFDQLLEGILKDEYIKNRITLMIKEMPLSVREIDAVIKVGPEVISAYVVDLWTGGKVTLHGFEDEDAKFISIGA